MSFYVNGRCIDCGVTVSLGTQHACQPRGLPDCVHCGRPVDDHAVMYACRAYLARAEDNARAAGAAEERARIVAFLTSDAALVHTVGVSAAQAVRNLADALERGEHLRGGGDHG